VRILKGRGFTREDIQSGGHAIIINENLARKYFADTDPIGRRIDGRPIVGVVSAVRDFEELSPTVNEIITPITDFVYQVSDLIVRTHGDPARLADLLRAEVAALDKYQEVSSIQTLEGRLNEMLAPRRFMTLLLGFFAQLALVLSAVGLYGLLQYVVTQRTRDIGIRMALGATQGRVVRSLLCQGFLLLALGTAVGLLGGIAASRLMASWLYEASPTDLAVLIATVSLLATVTLLATYLPARRAARIDPMEALRYE
jgi:putative ABC transport system permease protein